MRPALHQCRRRAFHPAARRPFTAAPAHFESGRQHAWTGYAVDALDAPLHSLPTSAPPPSSSSLSSVREVDGTAAAAEDALAPAAPRVVFGSRLAGPAARPPPPHLDPRSTRVAGVAVPPKPEEPDNCCMSGCVHCVWDRWREEMEAWAAAGAEAKAALAARGGAAESPVELPETAADGLQTAAGSGRKPAAQEQEDALFADVPVGIREFMRMEKRLRMRKEAG